MSDHTGSISSIPQDAGERRPDGPGLLDDLDAAEEADAAAEVNRVGEVDEAEAAQDARAGADLDLEAPEADAAEQRTDLLQHRDEPIVVRPSDEVDPADAAEQRRVVALDEDDYR